MNAYPTVELARAFNCAVSDVHRLANAADMGKHLGIGTHVRWTLSEGLALATAHHMSMRGAIDVGAVAEVLRSCEDGQPLARWLMWARGMAMLTDDLTDAVEIQARGHRVVNVLDMHQVVDTLARPL